MKKYILIATIFCISIYANSQSIIKGKITGKEDGQSIPGVNVYIPEIQKGCVSDDNGFYEFKTLPVGHFHIQFSMMGYSTIIKHINITKKPLEINVELHQRFIHSQEVVVSAGSYMTQHENAIKIETINAKSLSSLNNVSFWQSLSNIPGVDMISKGNAVVTPVIRGLSTSNILVLNNGVRLENFQFAAGHPFMTDEYGIDKIEVIKGPASLLYGSDAIGGVVNMIKEKNAATNTVKGDFNAVYHSNTDGYQGNLGVKMNKNDIYFGVRAGHNSHRDYTDGNNIGVTNSRFNNTSVKLNAGISKNFGKVELYYDYNKMALGMTVPPALQIVKNHQRNNRYWFQDLNNHLLVLKNTFFVKEFKINLNLSYQMNDRKLQKSIVDPQTTMVHMNLNTLMYELKVYLPTIGSSHIIVGLQGTNQENNNNKAPLHVLPDFNNNTFALYGLYQRDFGKKIHFQTGLRYDIKNIFVPDQYSTSHSNTGNSKNNEQENNNDDGKILELKPHYSNLSGSLGATYNVGKKLLLRANFASAYRTPNMAELTQNGMHANRYEQGDINLKSQRSYESDLSTHYHSKYIRFDVATFYNRVNNFIYLSPTNEQTEHGNKIFKYMQNQANLYGIETTFTIRPSSFINIDASYSYLLGEDNNGNTLPFIPQNKIRTNIKFNINELDSFTEVNLSVGATYAFAKNNPSLFESKTDDYFTIKASVACTLPILNRKVKLSINGHNLLNTKYFNHLSTLKPLGFYNMGRNFSFSIKVPFGSKL